jgi:plastocyanin
MRHPAAFLAVLATALAPVGAGAEPPEWTIRMSGHPSYVPDQVIVEEGETVRWVNETEETFTVTADPARAPSAEYVRVPPEGEPFDSGPIAPGESFERAFTAPGTYVYFSAEHVGERVVGTVTVERLDEAEESHLYGDEAQ